MLLEYLRNEKRERVGVVIVESVNGELVYGYSFTNTKAGDKFDKELGIKIAKSRLDYNKSKLKAPVRPVPVKPVHKIAQPIIQKLMEKGLRYFKGSKLGVEIPDPHH